MIVFTGICGAALIVFEICFPLWKNLAGPRIMLKTHMLIGGLAGAAVFSHLIAAGLSMRHSIAFIVLFLLILTILSGALAKYMKNKKLIHMHIIISVATVAVMFLHIVEETLLWG